MAEQVKVTLGARTEVDVDGWGKFHERTVDRVVGGGSLDVQEDERLRDCGSVFFVFLVVVLRFRRGVLHVVAVVGERSCEGRRVDNVAEGMGVEPEVGGLLAGVISSE